MSRRLTGMIVDDEPLARRLLRSLLEEHTDVEVLRECADGEEALEALRESTPDLVFLDIRMPGHTGTEVVEKLGREHASEVIFVTACNKHAVRAFELNAVDYLLKPFDKERLQEAVSRVVRRKKMNLAGSPDRIIGLLEQLQRNDSPLEHIVVKDGETMYIQPVNDVEWFEADGKYIRLHAGNKQCTIRETMMQLEDELDSRQFLRISRSVIVNLRSIQKINPWFKGEYLVTLKNGTQIHTTRAYRDSLKRLIARQQD